MLKIRLQRVGKKGKAYFRVVVMEHTQRVKGEYQELLGSYDPHQKNLNVKKDRIEYWISKGAQPSPTVNNLLVNHKVWDRPKMQSWKPKKGKMEVEKEKAKNLDRESKEQATEQSPDKSEKLQAEQNEKPEEKNKKEETKTDKTSISSQSGEEPKTEEPQLGEKSDKP